MPTRTNKSTLKPKILHIDPRLHKRWKQFCTANNKNMGEMTEVALKAFMKQSKYI